MTSADPLVICTAWNAKFAKLGELCSESILQHIRRVEARGGSGITFVSQLIPDNYPRPASWFKIPFIKELLQTNPHVLWMDCDALMMDQGDIREVFGEHPAPLQISEDENGVNCGVMAWHQDGGHSVQQLQNIENLYEEFKDHQWWEQGAIQKLMTGSEPAWWGILPKPIFNAYTSELCPETRILHLAGFELDQRIKIMEAMEISIRRNGWGRKLA